MMRSLRLGITATILAIALAAQPASAQSLTTTFVSDNYAAGNMFNLTIFGRDLTFTGMDLNFGTAGLTSLISVYGRLGGYEGFVSSSAGWTLLSQSSVLTGALNAPTFVDVTDFTLSSGSFWGLYVTVTDFSCNFCGLAYTNGSNTYANADLQLDAGLGKGPPDFTGETFEPRTWNGTLYYTPTDVVPEPATMTLLATGLVGMVGAGMRRRKKA